MNRCALDVKEYISASLWRRPEQLRGFIKNHTDVISRSHSILQDSTFMSSAQLALHDSETAFAVSLTPISGSSRVGLMELEPHEANLRMCNLTRWLSMPDGYQAFSVSWHQNTLLVGGSRGRLAVSGITADQVSEGSGVLPVKQMLTVFSERVNDLTPGTYAPCSAVRSVCVCDSSPAFVLAACGSSVHRWDLNHSTLPSISWGANHLHSPCDTAPILFTKFAPGSERVILSGNYEGLLSLADERASGSIQATFQLNGTAAAADFNPFLPHVFAAASGDGMISIYDVRHTRESVARIPSLQGALTGIQWLRLHSDLLGTSGVDGSVAIWNLRCPPTCCVGRAQYSSPVQGLVATETYLNESVIGVCLSGEVTQTALSKDGMLSLAASLNDDRELALPEVMDATTREMRSKESEACGFLYTRRLERAFSLLADCAEWRYSRRETARALHLVELTDLHSGEGFSYDQSIAALTDASHEAATRRFYADVVNSSRCVPQFSSRVRELTQGKEEDVRRLLTVRVNALLSQLLDSNSLVKLSTGVPEALRLLPANSDLYSELDSVTLSTMITFALNISASDGERFVQLLLEWLDQEGSGESKAPLLIRQLLQTAQRPLITEGKVTKASARFEEKFYRNIDEAKESVMTQLRITALGVDHYQEVIACAHAYQSKCVESGQRGMYGWLSLQPLIVYLNCLSADSCYVQFLWTSVQFIETFASFSGARYFEANLFGVVGRICAAGRKLMFTAESCTSKAFDSLAHLRPVCAVLKNCHHYLTTILRVQLECENVAIESEMRELPAVMSRALDLLTGVTEDLLNAWANLVDALAASPSKKLVCSACLPHIQEFSFSIEDLVDVSSKKENDDCLNEILETCDEFLDAVNPSQ